jgi:tRNA modification GTPase
MIREGRPVVLLGGPNAGKSSLFNALVGVDRAIVTPIAGTTRDLVTERADIGGVPMTLVDTAGLRADPEEVEREGIARAKAAIAVAALVLVVLDRSRPLADGQAGLEASHGRDRLLVGTKSDLPAVWECASATERTLFVSSVTGEGVPELRAALLEVLSGREEDTDVPIVSNVRHIGLLEEAQGCLDRAIEQAAQSAPEELILADLLAAGAALEDVLGRRTAEDVLTAIFANRPNDPSNV